MNMAIDTPRFFKSAFAKVLAALLCAALAGAAIAQERPVPQGDVDPSGRVGRLSDLTGKVWLYSTSAGEWLEAVRNRPITDGDRLSTEGAARAEIRIGSTTLRLDSATEIEVLRIDDSRIDVQLHSGAMTARLRSREAVDEFEVRTAEGRFRAQRTGRYRIDRIDDTSHLTVISGSAIYEGPGSALTVNSGQRAEFWLDRANVAQYTLTEPQRDAFAAWSAARDRGDDRSASTRYVSPEMTGVEDLDRHGRWETTDEYGAVWIPRTVVAGWAPYSTGHWVWISPWGWTWVDDAPWGFAPFHYGRWVYYRSNWCWTPGTYVRRPVYAPALVAWVGGPRVSVSVSVGAPVVGWFPLAPREVYVPSYRVSPRYVREVNHTHAPQIANVTQLVGNPQTQVDQRDFSNRKFPHAVTVVPSGVFTQRQPVAPAARDLRDRHDARELTQETTRGATFVAAPVATPPSRTLEARTITSPGVGNAGAAHVAPDHTPGGAVAARPWLRHDDQRRNGGANSPAAPRPMQQAGTSQTAPAAPAIQSVTLPQRPAQPAPPSPPAAANPAPASPAVAVAPSTITTRPAVPAAEGPARVAPAPPVAPEVRARPTRPGNEVPVAVARPDVRPTAPPDERMRGNHGMRPTAPQVQPQAPAQPQQPPQVRADNAARAQSPQPRPADAQPRERREPGRHEPRRDRAAN